MGKKIFGLDISDHSIEALVLAKPYFGKPKVVSYARTILRGEIVKNGVIKNPKKLGENIVSLLASAQPKPIKTAYCILSLPESQVFTTIFKLPAGLRRNEIKNTLPYKAEEIIPFKSGEVYFDFKTITSEGATQEVFYVAAPTKVVDEYVKVLESIGLKPVAFDLESVSLARALVDLGEKPDQGTLLMDIGARTTNLNIFDHHGIRQSLVIKIAGDRFTKALVGKLSLAAKEADELKMKNGFDPKQQKGKVLLVLQNEFKRIIAETKKLIDYYQSQNQRKIGRVVLAGGSALLPKVDQYLADNLGIEAKIGNPFVKIADPGKLVKLKNKAVLFSNVAGLALRGIDKNPVGNDINLLPIKSRKFALAPSKKEKKAWQSIYIRLAVLGLLLLAFIAIYFLRQNNQDIYRAVVPAPQYETMISPDVNLDLLEELRDHFLVPTNTPTTTTRLTEEEEPAEPQSIIRIRQTSIGYLNVREGPSTVYNKIGEVLTGEEYEVLDEEGDWYQIELEDGTVGWVFSVYVDKLE